MLNLYASPKVPSGNGYIKPGLSTRINEVLLIILVAVVGAPTALVVPDIGSKIVLYLLLALTNTFVVSHLFFALAVSSIILIFNSYKQLSYSVY